MAKVHMGIRIDIVGKGFTITASVFWIITYSPSSLELAHNPERCAWLKERTLFFDALNQPYVCVTLAALSRFPIMSMTSLVEVTYRFLYT
jgi:hypothetical protein